MNCVVGVSELNGIPWIPFFLGLVLGSVGILWGTRSRRLPTQALLDTLPGWGCLLSEQLQVLRLSAPAQELLGSPHFLEQAPHAKIKALLKRFLASGSNQYQVKVKIKVGPRLEEQWFLLSLHRLLPSRQQILMLGFDMRAQMRLEELIQDQKAALENSARMASMGQIAAGIAHEINNPLAVMTAKAFQVRRRLGPNADPKDLTDLQKIEATGYRVARIIKGLKNLSRDGEHDPLDNVLMKDVLKDVVAMCEDKLQKFRIELHLDIPKDLNFDARATQLAQVLLNLVSNAIDAIKDSSEAWIKIEAKADDLFVEIKVTDSGKGIPKELQEKIMTPFFTTKAAGSGTGLGLSISRRILADHHGELRYNPASRHTQFVIRLPRSHTFKQAS
ncbi:MAG: ATP-binding protein [Bdellovibrio sp.]